MDTPRVTTLLARVQNGDEAALNALAEGVYQDLRAMADRHMRKAFGGRLGGVTLQPTAIATDTFLKLIKQRRQFRSTPVPRRRSLDVAEIQQLLN